jgi:hypothetical protein
MAPHLAQRTLVKSRPELWAEVSDVTSLCKHLNDFGDITITRLEPETTVAWEGTAARGTVELETSGWGTKVTLTAELLDVDDPQPEAVPEPEPVAVVEPRPAREPEPEAVAAVDPEPAPEPAAVVVAEPLPEAGLVQTAEPEAASAKRPGFFARVFRRKPAGPAPTPAERAAARDAARATPIAPPTAPRAQTPEPLVAETPEPESAPTPPPPRPLRAVPDLEPESEPEIQPDLAPGTDEPDDLPPLVARAPLDAERAVAVLTGALDDLGAAHRRPFSNS